MARTLAQVDARLTTEILNRAAADSALAARLSTVEAWIAQQGAPATRAYAGVAQATGVVPMASLTIQMGPPPLGFPADQVAVQTLTPPTVPALPGYLSPVNDTTWGTKVVRISNTDGWRHAYAKIPAWNIDMSRIILGFTPSAARILNGTTYVDLGPFTYHSQETWSNKNPDLLFCTDGGAGSNILYSHVASTGVRTALHTFAGYTTISIGNFEGSVDDNDTYIALIGYTGSAYHLITYNIQTNSILADIALAGNPDNCQISRKGNYVVVVWGNDGTGVNQGLERYTRNLSSRINLYQYGRHGDSALDAAGNEVFVETSVGVGCFNLATGVRTNLIPGRTSDTYFDPGHVSGRCFNRPGWVYLSSYDFTYYGGNNALPGRDQVIALKTDGSGTCETFAWANHRSNGSNYTSQPQAVPSPDGLRVIFASEWGASGAVYDYVAGKTV